MQQGARACWSAHLPTPFLSKETAPETGASAHLVLSYPPAMEVSFPAPAGMGSLFTKQDTPCPHISQPHADITPSGNGKNMSESLERRRADTMRRVGLVVLAILWFGMIAYIFVHPGRAQWDFQPYYWAGRAWSQSLDPYDLTKLEEVSGDEMKLPFLYPPATLPAFALLSRLPYAVAAGVWMAVKLAALAWMVKLWRCFFLPEMPDVLFWAVLLFAFDAAVLHDLYSGNVSILEQALLWTGFWLLLKGQRIPAAILLALAPVFKTILFAFSAVLLVPQRETSTGPPAWTHWVLSASVFATVLFVPALIAPELYHSWLGSYERQSGALVGCMTPTNQSSWYIISSVAQRLSPVGLPEDTLTLSLGFIWVASVVGVSMPAFRRAIVARNVRILIMMTAMIYLLCVPSLPPYALILAIVPAAVLWLPMLKDVQQGQAAFAALVGLHGLRKLPVPLPGLVFERYSIMLIAVFWLAFLYTGGAGTQVEHGSSENNPDASY